jgi:hypothetical protein
MQWPAVYRLPSFLYPNTLVALTVLSELSRDMEEGERGVLEDLEDRGRGRFVSVVVVVKQGIMAEDRGTTAFGRQSRRRCEGRDGNDGDGDGDALVICG